MKIDQIANQTKNWKLDLNLASYQNNLEKSVSVNFSQLYVTYSPQMFWNKNLSKELKIHIFKAYAERISNTTQNYGHSLKPWMKK